MGFLLCAIFLLIYGRFDAKLSKMPKAWNNWYHVTVHTYGSWLRGDPRGWRARHHRENVDGDYRRPPPTGIFDQLHARSKSLMPRNVVRVDISARQFVLNAVIEKLQQDNIEVIAACLDRNHLHVLARFEDHEPRQWIGRAKKNASHAIRKAGLRIDPGGLWAKRSREEPIVGRAHQVRAFRYILEHAKRGAAVWRIKPTDVKPLPPAQ